MPTLSGHQCLLDRFEPLVPYAISAQMLEACDDTVDAAHRVVIARFKQINSASREFLKLFLLHLHHVRRLQFSSISLVTGV